MNGNSAEEHHLYITYPWVKKEEADFGYLTRQLQAVGLEASYDQVKLQSGESLWDQISSRITSGEVDGWAYLLTPQCLADQICREQLIAALDRTREKKGAGFPLLGLLHGISAQSLPPALKLRPCVHLADPNWREQVKSVFTKRSAKGYTHFQWKVHTAYGGDASKIAVEVCPCSEGFRNWRFAVPVSTSVISWGHGPSGGGEISPFRFSVVRGTGRLENSDIAWFGSEDYLSANESAYAVFAGRPPDFICFGRAKTTAGPPGKMEIFRTSLSRE